MSRTEKLFNAAMIIGIVMVLAGWIKLFVEFLS